MEIGAKRSGLHGVGSTTLHGFQPKPGGRFAGPGYQIWARSRVDNTFSGLQCSPHLPGPISTPAPWQNLPPSALHKVTPPMPQQVLSCSGQPDVCDGRAWWKK